MSILVFSDSHGVTNDMIKILKKNKNFELVIHLGDFAKDVNVIRKNFEKLNYEVVRGNNDWNREIPSEKIIEIMNKKIFITHGHHYGVKNDYTRIINKGKALKADAVLFGHTHISEEMFSDKMLVLNPGSIGRPVNGIKTYCIIDVKDNKFWTEFKSIR
ncbi:metallophosphoesterase [Herbivorax sp. ANBcel31]|uniref:metallophosphoesterase n=1 Tax=Herbivorax sp. ANBcel31 TaxID=3069754 RepID=UPI0027B7A72E|nr:metallophosphoesterase [Herbivorax sp. ANBcel31]MDQ2086031.1 metallophosphoesterase [Herbivorax sp. ANBcel31]